ncbi:hypothetical protein LTR08_002519 [Meristemomyces frigidus]|nr:hypothetical protein LTR08_002519 [Meristemomyces frigidus]
MKFTPALVAAFVGLAVAHPGHEEPEHELISKREYNAHARRGLANCADVIAKRGDAARAHARRTAKVEALRHKLRVRDTATVLNTTHNSTEGYTRWTPDAVLFNTSSTCILTPEGEVGPYWVKGEHIHDDIVEGQAGVPVVIEGQFLDIETCEPITNVWWDLWQCNATGVYSGIVESGNGNLDDTSNINTTFLRGIQKADDDGVVTFETIVPGHYSGRTNHNHMIAYLNATVEANKTLSGGAYAHIGQLFWDQDLITKVEATYPYNTNNITQTTNAEDRVFGIESDAANADPIIEYTQLGESVSDGLFGWVTIVVNTTATNDPAYSFAYTSEGGVAETGGDSGSSAGTGGNGTSGGASPTGAAPTASLAKRAFEIDWR